jgi:hypothetical protein
MTDTTTNTIDEAELAADAEFTDTLQRVAFQPGILLGADALTTEQSYHVRRMNRHQRWLVGPGTVFGLRVDLQAPAAGVTSDPVLLTVSPGYAIDGLGREVTVDQQYAISLRDWLAEQNAESTALASESILNIQVTVRAQAVPNQLQPVVAELFDAGLDPVVAARIDDSFVLEIIGDPNKTGATGSSGNPADAPAAPLQAWTPDQSAAPALPAGGAAASQLSGTPTAREVAMFKAAPNAAAANTLMLQSWLLGRSFPPFDDSPGAQDRYVTSSRLLLADVQITLASVGATPITANVTVNNLVRPFVPNILLAAMALP